MKNSTKSKLVIRIPNAREKSFWRRKNAKVARYFAFRYRGLDTLLGSSVEFDLASYSNFTFQEQLMT